MLAPVLGWYVPTAHADGVVVPAPIHTVPSGQVSQVLFELAPSLKENVPGGQAVPGVTKSSTEQNRPAGHGSIFSDAAGQ